MRKLLVFLWMLIGCVNFSYASISVVNNDETAINSEENTTKNDTSVVLRPYSKEAYEKEKSLQKQAEEIPVVFGQWWFWMGLGVVLIFLKFVVFKK